MNFEQRIQLVDVIKESDDARNRLESCAGGVTTVYITGERADGRRFAAMGNRDISMGGLAELGHAHVQHDASIRLLSRASGSLGRAGANALQAAFWRAIPAYREVSDADFLDHRWQAKHSIARVEELLRIVGELVPAGFADDAREGFARSTMSLRLSPYIVSLIDWEHAYDDPLRLQFVPVASRISPNHPQLELDSLHEQSHSPVPGLIHRYPDKALFLAVTACPIYCRFCTRSYAVGGDTAEVSKLALSGSSQRWGAAFRYIASRPEIEDVLVSGGDCYNLRPDHLSEIGRSLLAIGHVRRVRFASKGPAVMPQKLLSDALWTDALTLIVDAGRKRGKDVVFHTHFNHPREITELTVSAMDLLFQRGVTVRNQSVMQRGVNDRPEVMRELVKRLGYMHVHPYYVYVHDLVPGVEDLRTSLADALELEKQVRGATAGFNTPTFVVDAPGGGGKRDAHSFEHYDRYSGISVFRSPVLDASALYCYFDPLHSLSPEARLAWLRPQQREDMLSAALASVKKGARC